MTYPEALRYLETLVNYEKTPAYSYPESLKLERMKAFLDRRGNPQDSLAVLHVAGSKGKGSTCAFMAYILRRAGFSCGLYTSPHLADFRERIRVLSPIEELVAQPEAVGEDAGDEFEGMISCGELAQLVRRLKPDIEDFNSRSAWGPLTFFEVYTALAYEHFFDSAADFAVIETGLGGRLDATNTVCPLVCALTPVSYEHTDKLGTTLAEIAREKSGIIKVCTAAGSVRYPVVLTAAQEPEALSVIRARCGETGARLYEVGRDITLSSAADGFGVKGVFGSYDGLRTRLVGRHQHHNAALAIGAVEALRHHGIAVGGDRIRQGIADTRWPGRCEVLSREPLVILDGAQNGASALVLKDALAQQFSYRRLILVIGISRDKDIAGICGRLRDLADVVILTQASTPRAAPAGELAAEFKGMTTVVTNSVAEAKQRALALATAEDAVLVCGSLFVVGEFKHGSS